MIIMEKLARVVVVGAGGIGSAAHLPAVAALPDDATLVGIVDNDPARLAAASQEFGCDQLYGSLEQALAEASPDIVCIATPPHLHAPQAIAAMESGAWALVEKPMTGSLASADEILAAEERTGQWTITISQFRYAGGSRQVHDALVEGRWGRPLMASATTAWYRGAEYWDAPWRGKYVTEMGGCTTTQAHHVIDLMLWLMNDPWREVVAFADTLDRPIEVEDASVACVRFDGGGMATVLATLLSHAPTTDLKIYAQQAAVSLETLYLPQTWEWQVQRTTSAGTASVPDWHLGDEPVLAHRAQLQRLIQDWRAGEQPELTTADARSTLEFITALYKSAGSGQAVRRGEIVPGDPFYSFLSGAHNA